MMPGYRFSFENVQAVGLAMPNHTISKFETISEYHLLDLGTGLSYGGFASLEAARVIARERGLASWQIFRGNKRIEHHDPSR
jgi:hypothetical protein